jgi:hypothetical protein
MVFSSFKAMFKAHLQKPKQQKSLKLPLSVEEILRRRAEIDLSTVPHHTADISLLALYRIYTALVSGQYLWLRTEVERFWNRHHWIVSEISDPCDYADPVRYAVLATIPYLLIRAFNANIELGLPRDAPGFWTNEDGIEFRARPKKFESVPAWAEAVPALESQLIIPSGKGNVPLDASDPTADPDMLRKNILTKIQPVAFI